jgi:glutaredoxin
VEKQHSATNENGLLRFVPSGRSPRSTTRRQIGNQMARTIEIFSAGCATCEDTIELVKRLAGLEHQLHVHDMQHAETAARAKQLGVRSVPAVVVDGKLAGCCAGRGPDEHVLREALR